MSFVFFFFKQKTAYEMRISDWSSDVCSSDLQCFARRGTYRASRVILRESHAVRGEFIEVRRHDTRLSITTEVAVSQIIGYDKNDIEIGRASCRERVCQYV